MIEVTGAREPGGCTWARWRKEGYPDLIVRREPGLDYASVYEHGRRGWRAMRTGIAGGRTWADDAAGILRRHAYWEFGASGIDDARDQTLAVWGVV